MGDADCVDGAWHVGGGDADLVEGECRLRSQGVVVPIERLIDG